MSKEIESHQQKHLLHVSGCRGCSLCASIFGNHFDLSGKFPLVGRGFFSNRFDALDIREELPDSSLDPAMQGGRGEWAAQAGTAKFYFQVFPVE